MKPPHTAPRSGLITATFLEALLAAGERAGVDAARICSKLGITRASLAEPGAVVPLRTMTDAWLLVPAASGQPGFGLHAAEGMPAGAYGMLEEAVVSSATALEAFERATRYHRVTCRMSEVALRVGQEQLVFASRSFALASDAELRHFNEHALAFIATRLRLLAHGLAPLRVSFAHPAPADTREHQRIFQCVPEFGAPETQIVYARAALEQPLSSANAAFLREFEGEDAEIGEASAAAAGSTADRARPLIVAALKGGEPSVHRVARAMFVSSRTLQRQLKVEGTRFSALVDEVRRDHAHRWVLDGALSYPEIAFRLGFSQLGAFFRAFKRWTGQTPSEHKAAAALWRVG